MDNFEELTQLQNQHQKEHFDKEALTETDTSCPICYQPPEYLSTPFRKFLNWYQNQFNAQTYTIKTVEAFSELVKLERLNEETGISQQKADAIIASIRYKESPAYNFSTVRYLIVVATILSKRFTEPEELLIERLKNYYKEALGKNYETPKNSKEPTPEESPEKSPEKTPIEEEPNPFTKSVPEKDFEEVYNDRFRDIC
jgi:hypothetical protein